MEDKYELISEISSHATGAVYLVRHRNLKEFRVCKMVYKKENSTSDFLEADILLHLNHPAIVRIYDLEEDANAFYLVEEYLAGQSMLEYLLYNSVSQREFCNIAVSLCQIMDYLHNLSRPVLYLDLKLENIIYNQGQVKLIDFGSAIYEDQSKGYQTLNITQSYMSKEAKAGIVGRSQDMYALGQVLDRIYKNCPEHNRLIRRLINRQLSDSVIHRYSARDYLKAWTKISNDNLSEGKCLGRRIIVMASQTAVGCTHIAVSICSTLNYLGYKAVYVDSVDSGQVDNIGHFSKTSKQDEDIIYHRNFVGLRDINLTMPPYDFLVIDQGYELGDISHDDLGVLVFSSSPWKTPVIPSLSRQDNCMLVVNPSNKGLALELARELGREVYGFAADEDVFAITKNKRLIVGEILEWFKSEGLCKRERINRN